MGALGAGGAGAGRTGSAAPWRGPGTGEDAPHLLAADGPAGVSGDPGAAGAERAEGPR